MRVRSEAGALLFAGGAMACEAAGRPAPESDALAPAAPESGADASRLPGAPGATDDPGAASLAGSVALLSSSPVDGETSTYPVEIFDQGSDLGVGERRVLRFTFDAPMASSRSAVIVRGPGPAAEVDGAWSDDGATLTVTLVGTDVASPLEEEADYVVDLSRLRGARGDGVTTREIHFHTSARDQAVEHACIHTLFGPFEDVTAAEVDTTLDTSPTMGATHRQFVVSLPSDATGNVGQAGLRFSGTGTRTYVLFTDVNAQVAITDEAGTSLSARTTRTVAACPGIGWRTVVDLSRGRSYRLRLEAPVSTVKAIWETG